MSTHEVRTTTWNRSSTKQHVRNIVFRGKEVIYSDDAIMHQSACRGGYVDSYIDEAFYLRNGDIENALNEYELEQLLEVDVEYLYEDWVDWQI